MKRTILTGILALAAGGGALFAQQGKAQAGNTGPKPKSQAEVTAVNAMINANSAGPDAVIKAADELLTKFADTEFKEMALSMEADAFQRKGDYVRAEVLYQDVLKVNPKSYQAERQLGGLIVGHTGENDLNKDQELTEAEGLLKRSIEDVKTAPKPNPRLTDDQWETFKKQEQAEATGDLARSALLRKNYDDAIAGYKEAAVIDPQPAYQAYLAMAYQKAGRNDEALAICDKLLADPQLNPAVKNYTTNIQKMATAAKNASAPAAPK